MVKFDVDYGSLVTLGVFTDKEAADKLKDWYNKKHGDRFEPKPAFVVAYPLDMCRENTWGEWVKLGDLIIE